MLELVLSVAEFCRYVWCDLQNVGSVMVGHPIGGDYPVFTNLRVGLHRNPALGLP